MLNLIHLRTLVEVVRLGSFTAAGNRLGYTASAVSQQMLALEKTSNIRLFVRSARSIHPTQAAHAMSQQALKLLRDAEDLLAVGLAAGGSTARELRVGVFPSAATFVVSQIVELPPSQAPTVQVNISIGEPSAVVPGLRVGGELDVGIVYQVGESGLALPQGVSRHWLGKTPTGWWCPAAGESRPGRAWAWTRSVTPRGSCTCAGQATPLFLTLFWPMPACVRAWRPPATTSMRPFAWLPPDTVWPWFPNWPWPIVRPAWSPWTFRSSR